MHDLFQILEYGIDVHRALSGGPLIESLLPVHIASLSDGPRMHGQLRPHLALQSALWRTTFYAAILDVKLLDLPSE